MNTFRKLFTIALNDLTLAFRDRAALILMLAAPLTLALGLGLVTGRFSGNSNTAGLHDIPVVIVNEDAGTLDQALVEVMASPDLSALVKPITATTAAVARQQVADDQVAAALIIPAGFTQGQQPLELHANPVRPVSAGVVENIVAQFLQRAQGAALTQQVAAAQLLHSGRMSPAQVMSATLEMALASQSAPSPITLVRETSEGASQPAFDMLALLAPGMALLFLMYTVTRGGAHLLAERDGGTLARLFVTPTALPAVLGGKVAGIFLTTLAQVTLLIAASTLLFNLHWGAPLGLALLVPAVALAATGWGLLLTSLVKTPQQASSLGSAVMLVFGVLGGSFGNQQLPAFLHTLGRITPNAWGIEGFALLGNGGTVAGIVPNVLALLAIAGVTFALATLLLGRKGFVKQ